MLLLVLVFISFYPILFHHRSYNLRTNISVWVGNIILFPIKKDEFSPVQNLHPSLLDEAATASTLCVEPDLLEMIQELLLRKLT